MGLVSPVQAGVYAGTETPGTPSTALDKSATAQTKTGPLTALSVTASGKTGATATPVTLAGGTASGAPTTGAHLKGELVLDDTGAAWYCTVAGTPGTWVQINSTTYAPVVRRASGQYYTPAGLTSTGTRPNGWMTAAPFPVTSAATFDRIAVSVTSGGEAGALMRLGIYSDTNGVPVTLVLDAGTVAVTTTGIKAITISQLLTPGLYWLAAVPQAAPTTRPTCRNISATWLDPLGPAVASDFYGGSAWSNSAAGQGALPSPFGTAAVGESAVVVALRAA